jgi:hypothetical protein
MEEFLGLPASDQLELPDSNGLPEMRKLTETALGQLGNEQTPSAASRDGLSAVNTFGRARRS